MKTIFDHVRLGDLEPANRLIRSATWEALANADGSPCEEQLQIYEALAKGKVGAIITGFTSVDANDTYFEGMARLSSDDLIPGWRRLADICHAERVPVIMQLALGEFKRDGRILEPNALSAEQVREVIGLFGDAARRAREAGYDGVQIHAAHHFYLSRFISPAFNRRIDAYGGDVSGRAKILVDILRDMQKKAPGLHITMKINCSDFMQGGLTPEDALKTCRIMEKAGLDSVEVSGNGTSVAGIKAGENEAYFLPFAKQLKAISELPIILVGGHRSIASMNRIVNEEGIELLSLSRPLIREPDLIKRWEGGDTAPAGCISCNMCYRTPGHRCIFVLRDRK